MPLDWREYLRLWAPLYVYAAVVAVGAIYSFGYRNGVDSICIAAGRSVKEATCGH